MIALKSELAGRLIERDPAQARHEMREVEQVARQTLREVREAVAGYRQLHLESELDGARQVLEAAGIACQIEQAMEKLPPAIEAVIAWAIREGVTNVLRHSRARRCNIRVAPAPGLVRAEVWNDERTSIPEGSEQRTVSPLGSGLAGIAERVSTQGGRFAAGPWRSDGVAGFHLQVEPPLRSSTERRSEIARVPAQGPAPEEAAP